MTLEKLIVGQEVKRFPTVYGSQMFLTLSKTSHYSAPYYKPHDFDLHGRMTSILISFSLPRLLQLSLQINILYAFVISAMFVRSRDISDCIVASYRLRDLGSIPCRDSQSQSQSYLTTDGQSVSISLCRAPLWGPWPDFTFSLYFAGKLLYSLSWCALSDERTDL
jgi:hypothetical protein